MIIENKKIEIKDNLVHICFIHCDKIIVDYINGNNEYQLRAFQDNKYITNLYCKNYLIKNDKWIVIKKEDL